MSLRTLVSTAIFVIAAPAIAAAPAPAPPPPPPAAAAPGAAAAEAPKGDPSKTEGRFKNIQVLKGYPAEDLVPAMNFISASLGVDCEFCHVDRAPEKDDKDEKKIARKMITMTMAINRDNFDGHREVTCMSCHHGATHPVAVPLIAAERDEEAPGAAKPPELPAVSAVLDKYVQALGGAEALAKIGSRTQKGNLAGFGPAPLPVEVAMKGKDKRKTTIQTPRGENITAVNGATGWLGGGPRPPREMSPADSDAARLDAAILSGTDPRSMFQEFKVVGPENIEGKDSIKVIGRNPGKPSTHFWFDTQSGLLVRMVKFAETPLGRNPTQLDIADYRDADGVKNPYRWSISRPGSSFTIQIETAQQNAPVEDTLFVKPQ